MTNIYEKYIKQFNKLDKETPVFDKDWKLNRKPYHDWIRKTLKTERDRLVKCKNCGDKGYNTVLDYTTSHADFPGDKSYTRKNPIYRVCRYCDRGKEIEKLKEETTKTERERLVREVEEMKINHVEVGILKREIKDLEKVKIMSLRLGFNQALDKFIKLLKS